MGKAIRLSKKETRSQTGLRSRRKKIVSALIGGTATEDNKVAEPSEETIRWSQDILILRRAAEELARQRQRGITRSVNNSGFRSTAALLNDPSPDTRKFAVRTLYELDPDQAASLVNNALRDGSQEERRNIGTALADSGLLFEAIDDLMDENHERCYGAFSLLFLVAKAGVVNPLITVIEKHPNIDLRLAVIRLLAASKETQVVSSLEALADNRAVAMEVRSAAARAVSQISDPRSQISNLPPQISNQRSAIGSR
jgi:HEAT repeat protein